jgi:hypothetical protein
MLLWAQVSLALTVQRAGDVVALHLTPQKWSGPGLLGCRVSLVVKRVV